MVNQHPSGWKHNSVRSGEIWQGRAFKCGPALIWMLTCVDTSILLWPHSPR